MLLIRCNVRLRIDENAKILKFIYIVAGRFDLTPFLHLSEVDFKENKGAHKNVKVMTPHSRYGSRRRESYEIELFGRLNCRRIARCWSSGTRYAEDLALRVLLGRWRYDNFLCGKISFSNNDAPNILMMKQPTLF